MAKIRDFPFKIPPSYPTHDHKPQRRFSRHYYLTFKDSGIQLRGKTCAVVIILDAAPYASTFTFVRWRICNPMTQRAIDGQFIYFVTTITADRVWLFETPEIAHRLYKDIHEACRTCGFTLFAFCIMPDHAHLLVRKDGTITLSVLMKTIKGRFSFSMRRGQLWQPRSNFRIIDQENYFWNVISYIKYNFQKHALHERFSRYPYVYLSGHAINNLTAY